MITAMLEPPDLASTVARARSGDGPAFAELYRRHAPAVHAILAARVDPADAEELVQEVFLSAHRALATLLDPGAFGPWIHQIARNAAASRVRELSRRPRSQPLGDVPTAEPRDPDDDLRRRVLARIRDLPEAYRETLAMRLIDGMTGPEIAEATGLSPGSVRVNLHRGMDLLRPLLKDLP